MSTALKERLEAAVKAAEQFGDDLDAKGVTPSGEDLQKLTSLLGDVKSAKSALETNAEAKGTLADAKAFMAALSGDGDPINSGKSGVGSIVHPGQAKTFGRLFVESDAYQGFVKQYARNGVIPDALKGLQSAGFAADVKDLITGVSNTSGGALITNDVYSQITDLVGSRELTMRDVVTKSTTQSDTVEFVRVTTKTSAAAAVAEATTSASPTAPGSAGPLVPAAGGGYKPESGMAFERVSTAVKTLAHWIPITKRAAADAGQVRTMVDVFLREGLADILDSQMLTGNGSGENLTGILQTAGILTVGSAGTDIDAIVDAIKAVRFTGRRKADTLVIHPNDWYSTGFLLAKDTSGKYLLADPGNASQLANLWSLKVVISDAITENTALVGDFRYAVLWEREGVNVMVSDQHADFFTRNLLAILAEMRAAFGVLDPQAFCTVTAV